MRISGGGEVYSITFDQLRSSREDTYKSTELGLRLSVKYRVVDARTQEILYAGSAGGSRSIL